MPILIVIYVLHQIINYISIVSGNLYLSFFEFMGQVVNFVLVRTELFYKRYPEYKDKLLLKHALLKKKSLTDSCTKKLLKSQLNNTGYKKYYSFFQKLYAVMVYLILLKDEKKVSNYLTHKLETVRNYALMIKNKGLFSIITQPQYKRVPHNKTDPEIVRIIWKIKGNNNTWGRLRISYQLFLLGIIISPSTVRNYLNKPKPPETKKQKKKKQNDNKESAKTGKIKAKYPNHIWMCDFTTVKIFFFYVYVFFIIDVYSRKIIYYNINPWNPSSYWTITRIKCSLAETWGETPKHLLTDHGSQFTSEEFKSFCNDDAYNIKHRMGKIKSPKSTAIIERFNQSIKYEALNHIPFLSEKKLSRTIYEYLDFYNNFRSHQFLNGLTPNMKYKGIKPVKPYNNSVKNIKTKTFCDGLITAFYLKKAS